MVSEDLSAMTLMRPMRQNNQMRTVIPVVCTALATMVLIVTIALGFWPELQPNRFSAEAFGGLLPSQPELPGWTISRKPVAETEEMKRAVAEMLNFDAGSFVTYSVGDLRVSIYAAYWLPGKMSHRLIATHTPDVCWVGNGWSCRDRNAVELSLRGARKLPMEHRIFADPAGVYEHVVFCHFVGSRIMSYSTGGEPPWYAILTDLWERGLRQRDEQLFIRISSNRPLAEFAASKPVEMLLNRLASFPLVNQPDA